MMDHMVGERFVRPEQRESIWFGDEVDALFDWMASYEGQYVPKWVDDRSIDA